MASIIKVEHLSYVYNPGMPNAVTALDDVSFEVEEGDFVGIIGAYFDSIGLIFFQCDQSTVIFQINGGLFRIFHGEQEHQSPRWTTKYQSRTPELCLQPRYAERSYRAGRREL